MDHALPFYFVRIDRLWINLARISSMFQDKDGILTIFFAQPEEDQDCITLDKAETIERFLAALEKVGYYAA